MKTEETKINTYIGEHSQPRYGVQDFIPNTWNNKLENFTLPCHLIIMSASGIWSYKLTKLQIQEHLDIDIDKSIILP